MCKRSGKYYQISEKRPDNVEELQQMPQDFLKNRPGSGHGAGCCKFSENDEDRERGHDITKFRKRYQGMRKGSDKCY